MKLCLNCPYAPTFEEWCIGAVECDKAYTKEGFYECCYTGRHLRAAKEEKETLVSGKKKTARIQNRS